MKYALLPAPHPNARYDAELKRLCAKELACIASATGIDAPFVLETVGGLPLFTVQAALTDRQKAALLRASSLLALFSQEGEALTPQMAGFSRSAFFDMPAILKYKGKTNEIFTRFLLNLAVFSTKGADFEGQLTVLDPLCGKGTTLFCALSAGYDALGIELDAKEVAEAVSFVKAYLRNGHFRHHYQKSSATVRGRPGGEIHAFETAELAERYKAGDVQLLKFARGDSGNAPFFFKKTPADVIVADLPYGVQHKNDVSKKGSDTLAMLHRLLPRWKEVLKAGGAIALSFNSYTLKKNDVISALEKAGFAPAQEDWANDLTHWVEQAVLRDVAVARLP
ncbi:MAG: TRM11 family SAM-dependent methyltransferase [Christensenellales bacterium]|jgi:hypothetical protein